MSVSVPLPSVLIGLNKRVIEQKSRYIWWVILEQQQIYDSMIYR